VCTSRKSRAFWTVAVFAALACSAGAGAGERPRPAPRFDFGAAVAEARSLPRMHSLLVGWHGRRVLERYFHGRNAAQTQNVKSVSKSVISALVGIAIDDGYIGSAREPIARFFPATRQSGPDAAKGRITVGNLLSMQAGLETTSNRNYGAWVLSPNWVKAVLDQPFVDAPGTTMIYSTGNTHLLSAILTEVTGKSTLEFARDALGEPLGFRLASWPQDPQGIYFGGNNMRMTPREMLAFGQLYLDDGRIGSRQVVPSAWIKASFQARAQSTRHPDRYYGYGWWIGDMAGFRCAYAWGYGGQFIVLVPDLDLVVVTTSSSTPGPQRREHTRRVYDLVENLVIGPAAEALGTRARPQSVSRND